MIIASITARLLLTEFIGFTENEVKAICNEYDIDFEETKRWYDGYDYRDVGAIYNPNSVVKAAKRHYFGSYWTQTGTYDSIKEAINYNFKGLRDDIIFLLSGKKLRINTLGFENDMTSIKNNDDIFTLLVHLGYLAYDLDNKKVYIPNKEIAEEFGTAIKDSYQNTKSCRRALKTGGRVLEEKNKIFFKKLLTLKIF